MYCHKCGYKLENDAEFCRKCGKPVPKEKPVDIVEQSAVWTNLNETNKEDRTIQNKTITGTFEKEEYNPKSEREEKLMEIGDTGIFLHLVADSDKTTVCFLNSMKTRLTEEYEKIIIRSVLSSVAPFSYLREVRNFWWFGTEKNGKYGFVKVSEGKLINIPCILDYIYKYNEESIFSESTNTIYCGDIPLKIAADVLYKNEQCVLSDDGEYATLYRYKLVPDWAAVFTASFISSCVGFSIVVSVIKWNIPIFIYLLVGLVAGVIAYFSTRETRLEKLGRWEQQILFSNAEPRKKDKPQRKEYQTVLNTNLILHEIVDSKKTTYCLLNTKKKRLTDEYDEIFDMTINGWVRVKESNQFGFVKICNEKLDKYIPCTFNTAGDFKKYEDKIYLDGIRFNENEDVIAYVREGEHTCILTDSGKLFSRSGDKIIFRGYKYLTPTIK